MLHFSNVISSIICWVLLTGAATVKCQDSIRINNSFFESNELIQLKLISNFSLLKKQKKEDTLITAQLIIQTHDSIVLNETIGIKSRGNQRKAICNIPPLLLQFQSSTAKAFFESGKLKLVTACSNTEYFEQLLVKEYLVYKIYNLLTSISFRVRLVQIEYTDIDDKIKPYRQFAFLLEDVDDMAKRNQCRESHSKFATEQTNREQMTLVALFQYMIGNTDWAVPVKQNIKLISRTGEKVPPYAVPYDFDYSGLVNARYAIPHPDFEITYVTERKYLGFVRTMTELQKTLAVFLSKESLVYNLIEQCPYLWVEVKKEMKNYLSYFFKIAHDKSSIKLHFIQNARKQ